MGSPASGHEDCTSSGREVPGPLTSHALALFVYQTELHKAVKYLDTQPPAYTRRIRLVTEPTNGPSVTAGQLTDILLSLEVSFGSWIVKETQQATILQIDGRPVNPPSMIIEDLYTGGVGLARKEAHNLPVVGWWLMTAGSLITCKIQEEMAALQYSSLYNVLLKEGQAESKLRTPMTGCFRDGTSGRRYSSRYLRKAPQSLLRRPSVDLVPPHKPDPKSPVTQFLDRAYAENGAHSVIYISFGTLFFPLPSTVPHLMAALDEIPKAGFKIVFALSSEKCDIPEWANQTAVLEHPAIHYFLSHGGWNSSTEAIVHGVPMIFWPMAGDQPMNAIQVASVHDCGFEFLQVRTGDARSVAYRNGFEVEILGTEDAVRDEMKQILKMSKGVRGKHQRMNVRMLGRLLLTRSDLVEVGI
ncbi:Glycosyltransferase family 1 protein [Rhizoctonia solani]|uniref:Glycosyltransferase family 1 protein n=1 Tax=Rhizoctonia solani TaxID=456999 RepID=A0A8H7I8Z0_9AGAM|nr:Glycosyltransferase family 1 protein [Rhizoctonia solani]